MAHAHLLRADVKCTTADRRTWAVAKRYSEFKSLKDRLSKIDSRVKKLPFPKKTWGGSGTDDATVAARTEGLLQWTNEVVKMLPEDVELERAVCGFLAKDDSLDHLDEDPEACARVSGALGVCASTLEPPLHCRCATTLNLSLNCVLDRTRRPQQCRRAAPKPSLTDAALHGGWRTQLRRCHISSKVRAWQCLSISFRRQG